MAILLFAGNKLGSIPASESRGSELSTDRQTLLNIPLERVRAMMANYAWLKAHEAWLNRDGVKLQGWLKVVGTMDPRPLSLWLNGTRMLAYDQAVWLRDAGVPPAIARDQAKATALAHLRWAREYHPQHYQIELEEALLHLRLGPDLAPVNLALERASLCPGVPPFVGRVRAEFLVRSGRAADALVWLRSYRSSLAPGDPEAMIDLIEQRIRTLENNLGTNSSTRASP